MADASRSTAPLWRVASPYFALASDEWLDRFVSPDRHRFQLVGRVGQPTPWHQKSSARSSAREWRNYLEQARATMGEPSDGLIGVFPQVTATLAALARVRRDERPIVSWFFNTNLDNPLRQKTATIALARVDRFVVHSTVEIEAYSRILGLSEDRFRFVHLQYGGVVETERPSDIGDEPYVFSTGSGFRDYRTFFAAVDRLGYRTVVLAGPRALAGLDVPSNVEIVDSMSKPEIRRHVRHARVNVVPMSTAGLTAGVVTLVETFRHGRGVISTRRTGLEDYLFEDNNCLLTDPGHVDQLAGAIEAYWQNDLLRRRIDDAALAFADEHCTDAAAASSLVEILDRLVGTTASGEKAA